MPSKQADAAALEAISNGTIPVGAITCPMKRIGVNRKTAEAHGYEVRVDANGIEYSVKKGAITTMDQITGECGSSWVYFTAVDTSRHYSSVYTGFNLFSDMAGAIYVDWRVTVTDSYGVSNWPWHDPASSVHFE